MNDIYYNPKTNKIIEVTELFDIEILGYTFTRANYNDKQLYLERNGEKNYYEVGPLFGIDLEELQKDYVKIGVLNE
jgi:hypothetical protein